MGNFSSEHLQLVYGSPENINDNVNTVTNIDISNDGTINLPKPLPIASGGTNATTAANARTNLDVVQKNHLTSGTFAFTTTNSNNTEIAAGDYREQNITVTKAG